MNNQINNINRSATESLNNKTATTRSAPSSAANSPAGANNTPTAAQSSDTVSLSTESIQVRELQNRLADIPEVDAEKVATIKQEIANGNYPVDPKAIAANLLKLEKALSE